MSLEKWKILPSLQKCAQFWQNNCCHRLWEVAQSAINRPILSYSQPIKPFPSFKSRKCLVKYSIFNRTSGVWSPASAKLGGPPFPPWVIIVIFWHNPTYLLYNRLFWINSGILARDFFQFTASFSLFSFVKQFTVLKNWLCVASDRALKIVPQPLSKVHDLLH